VLIKPPFSDNKLRIVNSAALIIVDTPNIYQGKCAEKILGRKVKGLFSESGRSIFTVGFCRVVYDYIIGFPQFASTGKI